MAELRFGACLRSPLSTALDVCTLRPRPLLSAREVQTRKNLSPFSGLMALGLAGGRGVGSLPGLVWVPWQSGACQWLPAVVLPGIK